MSGLLVFGQAQVAKIFPSFGKDPFKGKVYKVDTTGRDDKPFKIHYDDGDKEWITLEELAAILVDKSLQAQAQDILQHGLPADSAQPQLAGQPKKRAAAADSSGPSAAAAAAKKAKAAPAADAPAAAAPAAAAAGDIAADSKPSRKTGRSSQQKTPAAVAATPHEAGTSRGQQKGPRATGRAAAAAATAAAAAAAAAPVAASAHSEPMQGDRGHRLERLSMKAGPGSAALPHTAQCVIAGDQAFLAFYSTNPPGAGTPGRVPSINYKAEADDVLSRLGAALNKLAVTKQHVVKACVYLRDMEEGLPGFHESWNAWVDRTAPPVLTVLQGSGPVPSSGVLLEAQVYVPQS